MTMTTLIRIDANTSDNDGNRGGGRSDVGCGRNLSDGDDDGNVNTDNDKNNDNDNNDDVNNMTPTKYSSI